MSYADGAQWAKTNPKSHFWKLKFIDVIMYKKWKKGKNEANSSLPGVCRSLLKIALFGSVLPTVRQWGTSIPPAHLDFRSMCLPSSSWETTPITNMGTSLLIHDGTMVGGKFVGFDEPQFTLCTVRISSQSLRSGKFWTLFSTVFYFIRILWRVGDKVAESVAKAHEDKPPRSVRYCARWCEDI